MMLWSSVLIFSRSLSSSSISASPQTLRNVVCAFCEVAKR